MKDKINAYIEKFKPLLEKIKPWIKTKKAWVQIGLSLVAIICLVIAGVSSCSRQNVIDENIKHTEEATEKPSEKPTDEPVVTATPIATEIPVTATPTAQVQATDSSSNSASGGNDPTVPDNSTTASSYTGPTGAPLFTAVPEESVSTKAKAYRTLVESCTGNVEESGYYLYDMDSDGVEELILHSVYDELTASIEIYTFSEDGLVFVGDAGGSFATISGCSRGGILVYYRRDGNESIENFIKTDYEMYPNTLVLSQYVNEYTVMEEDVSIEKYRIDDLSPIK